MKSNRHDKAQETGIGMMPVPVSNSLIHGPMLRRGDSHLSYTSGFLSRTLTMLLRAFARMMSTPPSLFKSLRNRP